MPLMPRFQGGINGGSHPVLARLRRQQLVDLARGFGVKINPDLPKWAILNIMESAEMNGVFNGPPVNPYYAERAKYSADVMKDLKAKVHESQWPKCLRDVKYWDGPSPDIDIKPEGEDEPLPHGGKYVKNINERNELCKVAKSLGINTKWMKVEEMKREIAIKRGELNAETSPQAA